MPYFVVEIWVGEDELRWQTEQVGIYAETEAAAIRAVAEDRYLPPGSWGDGSHPFQIVGHGAGVSQKAHAMPSSSKTKAAESGLPLTTGGLRTVRVATHPAFNER